MNCWWNSDGLIPTARAMGWHDEDRAEVAADQRDGPRDPARVAVRLDEVSQHATEWRHHEPVVDRPRDHWTYQSSKHGAIGFTKVSALECAKRNIRVNALCRALLPPPRRAIPARLSGLESACAHAGRVVRRRASGIRAASAGNVAARPARHPASDPFSAAT